MSRVPPKWNRPTEQQQQRLVDAVRDGAAFRDAAAFAGIAYGDFKRWLLLGHRGDKRYVALADAVKAASDAWAGEARARLAGRPQP